MEPYASRPIEPLGIVEIAGWRLKRYSIVYGGPFEETCFTGAGAVIRGSLPQPPLHDGRFGVGFVILHQGRGADYVVVGWWDRENELPVRVFLSESGRDSWRPAGASESFCVWDLQVLHHEREAWIRHVLATGTAGRDELDRYLDDVIRRH